MATRVVEGKKPYTGGKAISIDENKVISLNLRDENNLIIYDAGDDEIYVDLQLPDEIEPTDAFPVGITTGRVIVDNGWDTAGTIICAKTTSGDNIKLLYADNGKLYIDNGTGTFKQIYLKGEVDALLQSLRNYVDTELAKKQDKLIAGENITIGADGKTISATTPPMSRFLSLWNCATGQPVSFPADIPFEYITGDHFLVENVSSANPPVNYRPNGSSYTGTASSTVETANVAVGDVYIYDGTVWLLQKNTSDVVSFSQIAGQPTDNTNLATALNSKANASDVLTKTNTTAYTPSGDYNPATKKYVDDNAIAFKPFPNSFDTTHTTQDFLDSIEALHLPVGSAYLGQISTSDMPSGVTVQGDVEVYVYPQNIIYAVMKSTDVSPYEWIANSQYYRGWEATNTDTTYTAGDNIQISAQNVISATDTTYEAGSGIGITSTSISSRQGPCDDGWHVPSRADMQGVFTIMTSLSLTSSSDWETNLHIPYAEFRENHASIEPGDIAYLWTTTPSNNNIYAYRLEDGMSVSEQSEQRNYALSIRPFKNEYVAPDGTWTVVQGTLGNAGIFWNQTEGMITITDGTTGYTIADKNLGATTVYSHGDTLSQANCGNFYQRGNNYGFAWSGSITSVNSTVDASGYGPGNYYSGSTFLYGSGGDWSSVQNNNLWGDVTNSVSDVNRISNTIPGAIVSASAPAGVEGTLWYDTTNHVLKSYNGTSWEVSLTKLTILSYGSSTWNDFINAYNTNSVIYCRASSNTNPGTGTQGRMAFMAYINLSGTTPTSVEFQYYRSVSTKSSSQQTDQVFVYKLESTNGGTWTVVTREAGTEMVAGTGLSTTYSSTAGTLTFNADVISGVSGTTYTIQVSNSDPASGTPNTTITFVP